MRLPRFRFTVRGLMIAVATFAAALGVLAERRAGFLRIAQGHGAARRPLIPMCNILDTWWHGEMEQKYERAARSPWLPVAPDPPSPSALIPPSDFDEDYPSLNSAKREV